MDKPIFYREVPSSEQSRIDFYQFIEKNPKFQGLVKIGKTSLQNLSSRYSTTDYEQLTEENIFCLCASENVALEVEVMAQELTKEMETFIWRSDSGAGSSGGIGNDYLVYVTVLKPDLFKCPVESCSTVMTKKGIERHKLNHDFIANTIHLNPLLKGMDIDPMSTNVEPIPWKPEDALSTVCPDCGKEFSTRSIMNVHRKHNCPEFINHREKIKRPKCEHFLGRKEMWKHNLHFHQHKNRVICDLCGKELTYEALGYHMTVHIGTNKVPCHICQKPINFKSMADHIKFVHNKVPRNEPLQKCKVCGKEVKHMRAHMEGHKEEKIKCLHCTEMFQFKASLNVHIKNVHFKHEQEVVKCPQYDTKSFMLSHAKSHMPRVNCSVCGDEYSVEGLRKHMRQMHPDRIPSTSKSVTTAAPPGKKKKKNCPICNDLITSDYMS